MKIKFDSTLAYQKDAVDAVVNVFAGQPATQSQFEINNATSHGAVLSEHGIGNNIVLNDEQLLSNVRKVQEANHIEKVETLQGREFSIEMETGTGKTYVYLRSIFELSRQYGLKKYIIVVPSIAIREGVMKSIEMTKQHFRVIYGNTPFNCFLYDSKKLGNVRQFATSNEVQIMVINIQSFIRDIDEKDTTTATEDDMKKLNIINREHDKMSGHKPIDFVSSTNPVVIIDEPQSVDNSENAKRAIKKLKPVATLRYSATHRSEYNLLYKLDPINAYDLRLVKRIEVASVISEDNFNDAYVKLLKTDNKKGIKAFVEIHKETNGTVKPKKLWVRQGDDLYAKSGERGCYQEGYIIENVDCTPNAEYIEFNSNRDLNLGAHIGGGGGGGDDIMKAQVRETVEQHLKKETLLKNRNIKVLSLFFIDKVANYRMYNADGPTTLGKIGRWFEEAYLDLSKKPRYKNFSCSDISAIHDGYFSKDKKGRTKDTRGDSKDDNTTYNLIMRDKERLLDPKNPLRFIFSHSALREGWDNPNVFQICTLNESKSTEKKRQEIGRGLRLPVNSNGERIHDQTINRLTIVANESYEDFANSLQNEFEQDCGIRFGCIREIDFANLVRTKSDGAEEIIGQETSKKIFTALAAAEYISEGGSILEKFDPENPDFQLKIDEKYNDVNDRIIDVIKSFILQNRVVNARKQRTLTFKKEVHLSDDFRMLWDKIKHRTRYRVTFDTAALIKEATRRIAALEPIMPINILMTRVEIDVSKAGVNADRQVESRSREITGAHMLPDLLAYLQKETELTRHTLVKILQNSGRLKEFHNNPQKFMSLVAREISRALQSLMLDGIQYEKITNCYWEMNRIAEEAEEGVTRYLTNLYKVQNNEKCLFDSVEYDSSVEKKFAHDLDHNENVRLFVKLPHWFKIDTPIGPYNPDWAFVTERDEKLYFVRETKSTVDKHRLRIEESAKIKYGRRHFDAIDVNYGVATKLADVNF